MDPLILIIEEIDRMRTDLVRLEGELSDCEVRIDFKKDDPRYTRLSNEKELILNNLCDIRKELCQKAINLQGNAIFARKDEAGNVSYYIDKPKSPPSETPRPLPSSYPPATVGMVITPPSPVGHNLPIEGGAGGYFSARVSEPLSTERKKIAPTDLPDLPKYLQAKAELSSIMRDFTDNKIHFIGLDGHVIAMAEYQSISKFTKTGADPGKFMKGKSNTYKTGYNKKSNTFTENRLFIPDYQAYPAGTEFLGQTGPQGY